jgi:hypothetical protein
MVEFLRAQWAAEEAQALAASQANPGSVAKHWSAEKVDHRSDIGIWGKAWAVIPERVSGVVLALCPVDILPRVAQHIAAQDPAKTLARIAAYRQILDLHQPAEMENVDGDVCMVCDVREPAPFYPCTTLILLAQEHAGKPGFRPHWKV